MLVAIIVVKRDILLVNVGHQEMVRIEVIQMIEDMAGEREADLDQDHLMITADTNTKKDIEATAVIEMVVMIATMKKRVHGILDRKKRFKR